MLKFIFLLLIVWPILFIVSMAVGQAVSSVFFSTAGLIGIGGVSDAMVYGVIIGAVFFFVAIIMSLFIAYRE